MPRRQAFLETLAIFALFCLQGAWPVPEVNEPYYLGKAIHFWNPHWAASDWFLQTPDTHTVFYLSVGWLSLLLPPVALAWTLRLVTWALLAWSWQRLSAAIVPRVWASVLAAALFVFLLQHYNMAGEWVVGGAEAKGFSFVLVFLALEAMAECYWNRMWLLLGAATAIHPLVGGWAAVAAGPVWVVRVRSARAFLSPLAALAIALPGLVPPLAMDRGVSRAVAAEAAKIYVFERFPHHLNIVKMWNDGFVLPFLLLVAIFLLLWRTAAGSTAARRLCGFTATALALALIGASLGLWGKSHPNAAAGWMRFYWFRLADVAVPLGVALLAVRWFLERKMRLALGLAIAVACFHAADCLVLRTIAGPPYGERTVDGAAWRAALFQIAGHPLSDLPPRQPRADKLHHYAEWLDVCRWAADPQHTSPDARFIVPRTAYTFKWYSGRGEVVNWKESPQDAAGLKEWWERIKDIYATGNAPPQEAYYLSLADAGAGRLRKLAEKYQADYLVTQRSDPPLDLPMVYGNEWYGIYKMR